MDGRAEATTPVDGRQQANTSAPRPLHVLFVVSSLEHGGAERHTITLLNRLRERGHRCHAAFIKNRRDQLGRIRLGEGGTLHSLDARHFFDSRAVVRLAGAIADTTPSVIVAANEYALMYAFLALRRSGLRAALAVTVHAMRQIGIKEHLKMLAYRPLFWRADCAVFVCHKQRRRWLWRGVFARRNEVIHNGVNTHEFRGSGCSTRSSRVRTDLGFGGADYVIGVAAGLRPEKNHLQLVDAVARLRRQGIPARALLIGDGKMRGAIEARAKDLGVARHVTITGYQTDVRPYLSACDVAMLCSVTEAFSLAAIEAMALKRPVVHSDVGGACEMIVDGWNGLLFPVGDTDALVDRLTRLSNRTLSRSMGENARNTVERWFSERAMIDRYERLLIDLAQQHRADPGNLRVSPEPQGARQ
jgi:glycosyltransferase involved in cell wall biosynthesis